MADTRASTSIRLPRSIMDRARALARADGVSLTHWLATAVIEKVATVETAEAFFKSRRVEGERSGLIEAADRLAAAEGGPLPVREGDKP
jgi:hypothetical protein